MGDGGRSRSNLAICMLAMLGLVIAGRAQASGLYLKEVGTPAMGAASAGAGARAEDASTATHNAAGMTRLDDHALQLGFAPTYATVRFDPADDPPVSGSDGARLDTSNVKGQYSSNDMFFFNIEIAWNRLPWSGKASF